MSLGLFLYRSIMMIASPFLGGVFRRRVKSGKEDRTRISERFVRNVPKRPNGNLVWLHAASVGESQLLLELMRRLLATEDRTLQFVLTCQTQTAARLVQATLTEDRALSEAYAIQQMAPVDTPANARRSVRHWSPSLFIAT